ncbi:malectin domain-containing carbohydrate-binding protein [Pedosphaera parvula]|uniref:Glucan endo-1,3-beta-D-glucosidase n=1 Tax=Pedosphaera parvula (strain Ellin514) TaxID=320771 RepID=B9XAL6_PEDPL|nr:family 16 glycosylhydrolase [Pedosphaera parvula]EEF63051.1 Glucan endo-1,3-beta-D-glucosidase [Pedosphaera parvula Ellin514]
MKRKLKKHISRSVRYARYALLALMLAFPFACQAGWQLVWSDEFNQVDGSSPASTNWTYDVGNGNGGWGNNQLEYDTSRTNNARIQGGQLVIEARQENTNGFNYTSTRMKTQGKWSWTYGRIEASIKLPKGQGIWPAFWMLGANIDSVGWPNCGEIDIMENIGNAGDQGTDHGTIHGPQSGLPANCGGDYNCYSGVGGTYTMPGGARLSDGFHVFAIEWTTNQIKWYCDTNVVFTATPASLPSGGTWVFTAPQFLILNLAVGGNWPGNPDGTTVFPQQMLVDYVRVYSFVPAAPDAPTGLTASPGNAKVYLSWDVSNSDATGYIIKRAAVSGGSYITVGTTSTNNFTDSGVFNCSTYYYVVSATNSLGESMNSSEQTAALGEFALAVNSGGSAVGQFGADAYFTGGTQAGSTTAEIDTSGLVAPAPQAVYQTERFGNCTYTFTGLTSGLNYKVRLHFAEYYWTAVGQRRFNVSINGTQVLTNFDILAVTGAQYKATIQEFTATANNGQITVQYTTVTDNAKSGGIEILLARTATPTASNNGPIWTGMTLNLTASTVSGATYHWTGPDGFTSTKQNPSIVNASTKASGLYSVTAIIGTCASTPATTAVTVNPPARLTIQSLGQNLTIGWPAGVLQSATNVSGPWSNLSVVTPLNTNATATQQFYRLKLQ